jgi:hypothetical protein
MCHLIIFCIKCLALVLKLVLPYCLGKLSCELFFYVFNICSREHPQRDKIASTLELSLMEETKKTDIYLLIFLN